MYRLVQEHGDALEADLQRHYHVRLSDVFTGELSWRRLTILVEHLPYEHATRHALGDETATWGLSELLLATAVDNLRAGNWQRAGGKGAKPKPIPRPGVTEKRTTHHGHVDRQPQEVAAYFASLAPPPLPDEGT